ncbi:hypothetical protein FACS1894166_00560 [Bacilli bacterium]|nr:hypothetical protein FACS1894166_00560 [Bacilli bacterium]
MKRIQLENNNAPKNFKVCNEPVACLSTNSPKKRITPFKFEEEYSFQSVDEMLAKAGF